MPVRKIEFQDRFWNNSKANNIILRDGLFFILDLSIIRFAFDIN